jgi:hypothetical protein
MGFCIGFQLKKLTCRKLFGNYIQNITSHAAMADHDQAMLKSRKEFSTPLRILPRAHRQITPIN